MRRGMRWLSVTLISILFFVSSWAMTGFRVDSLPFALGMGALGGAVMSAGSLRARLELRFLRVGPEGVTWRRQHLPWAQLECIKLRAGAGLHRDELMLIASERQLTL